MKRRTLLQALPAAALLSSLKLSTATAGAASLNEKSAEPPSPTTVYELRIYYTVAGKLPDLLARFRDHTDKLFARHGLKSVAYWVPSDEPAKSNMLIYILEHPSREAAKTNWKSFGDDPEWNAVREKSEAAGKIVEKVDSTYMSLTDFSKPLR